MFGSCDMRCPTEHLAHDLLLAVQLYSGALVGSCLSEVLRSVKCLPASLCSSFSRNIAEPPLSQKKVFSCDGGQLYVCDSTRKVTEVTPELCSPQLLALL